MGRCCLACFTDKVTRVPEITWSAQWQDRQNAGLPGAPGEQGLQCPQPLAGSLAHSGAQAEWWVNCVLLLGGMCSFHKHLVNAFGARAHPKFIPGLL